MNLRRIRHKLSGLTSKRKIAYYRIMGIKIGKGCWISRRARIDVRRGEIQIGNNVSIASGALILGHIGFQDNIEGQKTIIEDNTRIFVQSIIFPGVKIGKNSVVSAGAVVMKDVPPNVVVMGNPARVVQRLEPED
jgi:acetyltransferase-like isoleucine patch superfamily enzyme